MPEKTQIDTINLTPTWSNMLPAMLILFEELKDGSEGKEVVLSQFRKMAKVADMYVASQRETASSRDEVDMCRG